MKRCHGPLSGTGHGTGGIIPATLRQMLDRRKRKLALRRSYGRKRWSKAWAAVFVAALALSGCSTVSGSLLQRGAKAPSEQTVKAFIRLGQEDKARQWLLRLGVSDARIDELIVLAQRDVAKERAECTGLEVCP
jgi:hypothetical protein